MAKKTLRYWLEENLPTSDLAIMLIDYQEYRVITEISKHETNLRPPLNASHLFAYSFLSFIYSFYFFIFGGTKMGSPRRWAVASVYEVLAYLLSAPNLVLLNHESRCGPLGETGRWGPWPLAQAQKDATLQAVRKFAHL